MIVASTTRSHSCYAVPTLLTTAFVGWLLSAGTLWAQQKPDPLAAKAGEIKMTLRAGDIPAADEQQFDDFFNKYFFKQFVTPARPYSLDNLAKVPRHELDSTSWHSRI
ncbi:MAG: hypothetical protein HY288_08435 [Planctomycetia bacterium]|nr:hypothetical protein [Planctomycetia bacterium]